MGIRLEVVPPFESSTSDYVTTNGGKSFRHLLGTYGPNGADMLYGETETNPKTIATLRQIFEVWDNAKGYTEKRKIVYDTCSGLRALLCSLPQVGILPHLQDVARIQAQSQAAPDDKFEAVAEELVSLTKRLKTIDAMDGDKILSGKRYDEFLSKSFPW